MLGDIGNGSRCAWGSEGGGEGRVGVVAVMVDGLMHTGKGGGGVDAMIYSLNSPTRSLCLFADPQ